MFTPIQNELEMLIHIIRNTQEEMILDLENMHNLCIFTKQEGGIAQLGWVLELITTTYVNINEHIKNIMENAADGNYSAKIQVLEDENIILKEKIRIYEQEMGIVKNNLDKENKVRTKVGEIEEGLET